MSRALALVVTLLASGVVAAAPSRSPFDPGPAEPGMSNEEITRFALPYMPRIARCYRIHVRGAARATGDLQLRLAIARDGRVVDSDVTAPGVLPRRLGRLTQCVRSEVARWKFPARPQRTMGVISYYFLLSNMPASGHWHP